MGDQRTVALSQLDQARCAQMLDDQDMALTRLREILQNDDASPAVAELAILEALVSALLQGKQTEAVSLLQLRALPSDGPIRYSRAAWPAKLTPRLFRQHRPPAPALAQRRPPGPGRALPHGWRNGQIWFGAAPHPAGILAGQRLARAAGQKTARSLFRGRQLCDTSRGLALDPTPSASATDICATVVSAERWLFKLLLVMAPCALVLAIIFAVCYELRLSFECQSNLRALYHALELYEMERGALPKLAFFPTFPRKTRTACAWCWSRLVRAARPACARQRRTTCASWG